MSDNIRYRVLGPAHIAGDFEVGTSIDGETRYQPVVGWATVQVQGCGYDHVVIEPLVWALDDEETGHGEVFLAVRFGNYTGVRRVR